ncbi:oligosaccharide flippase family protein [Ursidibacter sp. B-7004-1]
MAVIKDSFIYLSGELISKSVPFLLLPYLSRKLGVEGYGELSYYQTFLSLFVIFIGLSQDDAVARYFYVYGRRSLNLVVNTGCAYTLCVGISMLVIFWMANSEIMAYIILTAMFQVLLSVQLSVRHCQKQAVPYTIIQLSSSLISAVITVAMLEIYQTELVEKRFIALLLANSVVVTLTYIFYNRKYKKRIYKIRNYKTAFLYFMAFGLPMLLHHGSIFIQGQLDRIFIYHQFSKSELGLYTMGVQIASILFVVILAINKALVPYLFEKLKEGVIKLKDLHKYALYSLMVVPIPSLIVLVIPERVFSWVLGGDFIGVKYYVIVFLFVTTLTIPYFFLANYLFYHGKTKQISFCSMLSTLLYFIALSGLILTEIKYIPYASIIGAISILPVLYFFTKKVGDK